LKVLFQNKLSLVGFILNPPSADRVATRGRIESRNEPTGSFFVGRPDATASTVPFPARRSIDRTNERSVDAFWKKKGVKDGSRANRKYHRSDAMDFNGVITGAAIDRSIKQTIDAYFFGKAIPSQPEVSSLRCDDLDRGISRLSTGRKGSMGASMAVSDGSAIDIYDGLPIHRKRVCEYVRGLLFPRLGPFLDRQSPLDGCHPGFVHQAGSGLRLTFYLCSFPGRKSAFVT